MADAFPCVPANSLPCFIPAFQTEKWGAHPARLVMPCCVYIYKLASQSASFIEDLTQSSFDISPPIPFIPTEKCLLVFIVTLFIFAFQHLKID